MTASSDGCRWLLLIHQLPHKPAYLRVKIGRRLAGAGAISIKSSVYALPNLEGTIEDFQWIRREILEGGGDATIVEAELLEGLTDIEVEDLFRAARDADFAGIVEEARRLTEATDEAEELPGSLESDVARLSKRLADINEIDFFGASQRETAAGLVGGLRARLRPPQLALDAEAEERPRARTWVTRAGVHVDRIASAWLIQRFIDPDAAFKFVPAKG